MTTIIDFITQLFHWVDDKLTQQHKKQKHRQTNLYLSKEIVISLLVALKGVRNRVFYHWMQNNYKALFPKLLQCTKLVT